MKNRNLLRVLLPLILLPLIWAIQSCGFLESQIESGAVLFQDDFSYTRSGWDRYKNDRYESDYVKNGYRIQITTPETNAWSRPHLNFNDVRIQVAATKIAGPDNNVFGVLCRYQDPQNFYFFLLSSDGYSGIGVFLNGQEQLLSGNAMLPSAAIFQGSTTNLIRADCIGNELSLYINGVEETKVRASHWSEGDVGLIAGTYAEAGTEILFEKFSVIKP
jgi:hypothetical protein